MPTLASTPYPDESLVGFIFRLARRRRLLSGAVLARSAGFEWLTNRPRPEWLAALAEAAELPVEQLQAVSFGPPDAVLCRIQGRLVRAKFLDRRGSADRKVCPECLAESAHHRAIWDLSFISTCARHSTVLVDECSCGQPLRWGGTDLTRNWCKRKCDLTRMRSIPIPADELRGARTVAGLLGDEQFAEEAAHAKALEPNLDLDEGEIVDLIYRVGIERAGGGGRAKVFSVENPGELAWNAHQLFNLGVAVAEDWPTAFHEILDAAASRISWRRPQHVVVTAVERWLDGLQDGHGVAVRSAVMAYRQGVKRVQRVSAEQVASPASGSPESSECGKLPGDVSTG